MDLTQNRYSSQWRRDNFGPKRYKGEWKIDLPIQKLTSDPADYPVDTMNIPSEQEAKQAKQKIMDWIKQEKEKSRQKYSEDVKKVKSESEASEIREKWNKFMKDLDRDIDIVSSAKIIPVSGIGG